MMRQNLRRPFFVLMTIACFVLESNLEVLGMRPNLTVIPVYYVGLRHGPLRGVLFGALVGAIVDGLSGNILGPSLLSKGAAALIASAATGGFLNWTPVLGIIWMFVVTCADGALSYTAMTVFAEAPTTFSNATLLSISQGLVNSIAGFYARPRDAG